MGRSTGLVGPRKKPRFSLHPPLDVPCASHWPGHWKPEHRELRKCNSLWSGGAMLGSGPAGGGYRARPNLPSGPYLLLCSADQRSPRLSLVGSVPLPCLPPGFSCGGDTRGTGRRPYLAQSVHLPVDTFTECCPERRSTDHPETIIRMPV